MSMRKKILSMSLVATMLISSLCGAFATAADASAVSESDISVVVNGVQREYQKPPIIKNNASYLPLRELAQDLKIPNDEQHIQWNASAKTVTLISEKEDRTVVFTIDSKTVSVNGQARQIYAAPILWKGSTYLPIRAAGEAFDMTVKWDEYPGIVYLKDTAEYERCMKLFSNLKIPVQSDGKMHITVKSNGTETDLIKNIQSDFFNMMAVLNIDPTTLEGSVQYENESMYGKRSGNYVFRDKKLYYKASDGKEYFQDDFDLGQELSELREYYLEEGYEGNIPDIERYSMYAVITEKDGLATISVPVSAFVLLEDLSGTAEMVVNTATNEVQSVHVEASDELQYDDEEYKEHTKTEFLIDIDFTK